jgi:hypothetical protein
MKKLVNLLSIVAISACVSMWSCKGDPGETGPQGAKGDTGAAGVNGTNGTNGTSGKDGNANVKSFLVTVPSADWKETLVAGVGSNDTSKWGSVAVSNPLISTSAFVMVFLKNGEVLKALPLVYTKDIDNSLERLDYSYKTGQLELLYRWQSQIFGGQVKYKPDTDVTVEVVVTSKTIGAALINSGVNMKNRTEVMNFINSSN